MTWHCAAVVLALVGVLGACGDDASEATRGAATSSSVGSGATHGGEGGTTNTASGGAPGGAGGWDGHGGADVPLAGLGEITGDCGVLNQAQLSGGDTSHFANALDFGVMPFDYRQLSGGAKKVHDDGNLGGSSLYSEIFAYEILYRCELANLLKTEGEIAYQEASGKKTDLLVTIDGIPIGVSVTRAVGFPKDAP